MKIEFNDLRKQYLVLKDKIDEKVMKVLSSGEYISGNECSLLEDALCEFTDARYCVTCSNGTDALMMSLMSLGIGAEDAVFVPAFTFIATSEAVCLAGAVPVFCDVRVDTFNLDTNSLEEAIIKIKNEGKLTPKAVIAVDLFGLPFDYYGIKRICDMYGLTLIEDAAQGFGGKIGEKNACTLGHISATSFFPAKPLGCYGDGGAVFTDDSDIYRKLKSIRVHGKSFDESDSEGKYKNVLTGLNARLDTVQAAVLLVKLENFNRENDNRIRTAGLYNKLLKKTGLKIPSIPEGYKSSFAQYTVTAGSYRERKQIMNGLKEKGVPSAIYYPIPLHLQKVYENFGYRKGMLPVSEKLCETVFSLPIHGYITESEAAYISDCLYSATK